MDDAEAPEAGRDLQAEGEGLTPKMFLLFTAFACIASVAELAATQPPEAMRRHLHAIATAARKGMEEVKAAGGTEEAGGPAGAA